MDLSEDVWRALIDGTIATLISEGSTAAKKLVRVIRTGLDRHVGVRAGRKAVANGSKEIVSVARELVTTNHDFRREVAEAWARLQTDQRFRAIVEGNLVQGSQVDTLVQARDIDGDVNIRS